MSPIGNRPAPIDWMAARLPGIELLAWLMGLASMWKAGEDVAWILLSLCLAAAIGAMGLLYKEGGYPLFESLRRGRQVVGDFVETSEQRLSLTTTVLQYRGRSWTHEGTPVEAVQLTEEGFRIGERFWFWDGPMVAEDVSQVMGIVESRPTGTQREVPKAFEDRLS